LAVLRALGGTPRPFVPPLLVVVTVLVVLATGLAASVLPSRRAVIRGAVEVLRSQRA